MSKLEVDKVIPQSGTTLTIGDSGDTTNIVGTLQNNGSSLVGDISSVVAGTNLSGGGTSGDVTLNLADASTSAKGAASFSSDNFAASSGAITIKDAGIATAEIQDDAVTADKLDNSINSAITANTAKVTNATHSGEVTGATALTIADNIVDEANLKVSNSPTNGYFLSAQSGNTGGLTWAEVAAGGITGADFWRLNTDVVFGADTQVLDSNWERVDTDGYGVIGSAMTQSSGIFTFPTTGIWVMNFQVSAIRGSNERLRTTYFRIQTTQNNSSYSTASQTAMSHPDNNYAGNSGSCSFIFDVTNTSNDKVRTEQYEVIGDQSNISVLGGTADTVTGISFIRLADT